MAVTVRLRDDEEEMIKDAALEMMFETKIRIKESDLIHTLIRKYREGLKNRRRNEIQSRNIKKRRLIICIDPDY